MIRKGRRRCRDSPSSYTRSTNPSQRNSLTPVHGLVDECKFLRSNTPPPDLSSRRRRPRQHTRRGRPSPRSRCQSWLSQPGTTCPETADTPGARLRHLINIKAVFFCFCLQISPLQVSTPWTPPAHIKLLWSSKYSPSRVFLQTIIIQLSARIDSFHYCIKPPAWSVCNSW